MSIESEFKKFIGIAERIAVAVEKIADDETGYIPGRVVNVVDETEASIPDENTKAIYDKGVGDIKDELGGDILEDTEEDAFGEPDDIPIEEETKTVDSTIEEDGVEGEKVESPLKISKDMVKKEARALVDGFPEDRKGFEKAKKILKKLGAEELADLAPVKYADAVNAFRKAVKTWS